MLTARAAGDAAQKASPSLAMVLHVGTGMASIKPCMAKGTLRQLAEQAQGSLRESVMNLHQAVSPQPAHEPGPHVAQQMLSTPSSSVPLSSGAELKTSQPSDTLSRTLVSLCHPGWAAVTLLSQPPRQQELQVCTALLGLRNTRSAESKTRLGPVEGRRSSCCGRLGQ